MQLCEVRLEALRVLGPRHLVDTFSPKKLARKNIDVDVMQERRQLALSVPGDGFSYAGLRM
jgi:hypothetical protein